jgi:hypothetical protein
MIHKIPTVHPYLLGYQDCAGNFTPKDETIPMTAGSLLPHPTHPYVFGKFLCQPGECQFDANSV